jgi:hypothetical protein
MTGDMTTKPNTVTQVPSYTVVKKRAAVSTNRLRSENRVVVAASDNKLADAKTANSKSIVEEHKELDCDELVGKSTADSSASEAKFSTAVLDGMNGVIQKSKTMTTGVVSMISGRSKKDPRKDLLEILQHANDNQGHVDPQKLDQKLD